VQQKMIQQNGGHPVSSAEIQRQQVQQHLAPAPAPIVKIAPPVAVSGNQAGAKPGQPQQSDTKQNQRAEAAHSEKENSGKPTGPVKSTELAKPANQQNGPVRDMRAPAANQPEHANQPQITNVTNRSEVKANPQTQGQPAVPQKDNARKDQPAPVPAQPSISKSPAPTTENKPSDAKSQNAPPVTNDKVKANPQTQGQPEVLQKNDARRDQPAPVQVQVQAPVSKNLAPAAESKPSDAKSQNAPPATNNNPANHPPTATSPEDQRKQAEPKGQQKKGQQAQPQQKPDKNQKASDTPAQQPK